MRFFGNQTWEYASGAWTQVTTSGAPPGTFTQDIVYHDQRKRVLLRSETDPGYWSSSTERGPRSTCPASRRRTAAQRDRDDSLADVAVALGRSSAVDHRAAACSERLHELPAPRRSECLPVEPSPNGSLL
jgi:hypothetical protein